MKCFCPVNGLYCKILNMLVSCPRERKASLTREKSRSRLNFAFLQVRSMRKPHPPQLRILAASQYERKAPLREFAISQARSITLGVLTQKPAC